MWVKDSKLEHFLRYIEIENLQPEKDRILIGVSGGVDSMVLAHLFVQAGFTVGMAHVNYGRRGEDSDKDERLVLETATAWDQTYHHTHYVDNKSTGNFQEKARDFRYNWFFSLMKEYGYNFLALAHHADDQTETFFMQLLRSAGLNGLSGIKARDGNKIRPLLKVFKSAIYQYAEHHAVPFREDQSNSDNKYRRNWVRNEIIPIFEKQIPGSKQQLLNSIEHLQSANLLMNYLLKCQGLMCEEGDSYVILKEHLTSMPEPKQALYWLLHPFYFNYPQCANLYSAAPGSRIVGGGYIAIAEKKYFRIFHGDFEVEQFELEVEDFGTYVLPHGRITIQVHQAENDIGLGTCMTLVFNHNIFPLKINNAMQGRTISPCGMKGRSKTIKKLMADYDQDLWQRNKCFLIEHGQKIICAYPLRSAEGYCQHQNGIAVDFIFTPLGNQ